MFAVIADSPFSSCCTDYMSAKHIEASVILHFGYSCGNLSPIVVMHFDEPIYPAYNEISIKEKLLGNKIFVIGNSQSEIDLVKIKLLECNKEITVERSKADSIICVGNGYNISSLIENSEQNIWILTSSSLELNNSYQFISKRYHFISQVSSAKVFGIIILSLPVYNKISSALKTLLYKFEKIFYPMYVGKITALKLGNFKEIDMFVLVGCKNSPLPDNKILYKPVITPYELEVGLKGGWNGKYSTIFLEDGSESSFKANYETASRFSQREFQGLIPEVVGNLDLEEGYSGIATKYKSEKN